MLYESECQSFEPKRWKVKQDKQKCILIRYDHGDEIKKDKMSRTSMHGKDAK
jgi:hypothetical protein